MNTIQIDKMLNRNAVTKKYYIGCYASNCIPYKSTYSPFCAVINIDPNNSPGTHWIAIFCDSVKTIEYYDSLGIWPPMSSHIRDYLEKFQQVRYNSIRLQGIFKRSCGPHAIFYLYMRCSGFDMNEIISFLKNINADKFVTEFIASKIFNIHS